MEDEEANLLENKEDDVEQSLFVALKEDSIRKPNTWYLNNGASNHMTGDKSKFVELDTNKKGFASFGDNTKVKIEGKEVEPLSFEEAKEDEKWRGAMDEEMLAIVKNDTWELVSISKDHETIGIK
ncbi:uncharacterized protein LOC121988999 [Zingiber officinale]|uniref:uncharacterized protein LOC121988999 n=1 Tax=Zingiber officinale TaxID=94328 RepID=UPI001C4A9778|nr:uncharacterized protein LOC121988999 [Zingiber officinale]XP_042398700.1 uncharacterized protein LOC121988999 [Zingiber officinale]XP_042398701.1 uncharacterized protein LOC121988999 [Zingiber officinale]